MTLQPGNAEITVSWQVPETDGGTSILGYNIYMNKHGDEMSLAADAGDVQEYTVGNLENGLIYYFQVRAYNMIGEGIGSKSDLIRPEPFPRSPENFRTIDMEGKVRLAWSRPQYSGEYPYDEVLIYRGIEEDNLELYTNVSYIFTEFYDEDVVVGTAYYYELTITSRIGEGLPSSKMVGRPFSRPSVPRSFTVETGNGAAFLEWDLPQFLGGRMIDGFKIHRGTQEDEMTVVATVPGTQLFFNDTTLTNGITYYYKISALNSELEGNTTIMEIASPTGPPKDPRETKGVLDLKNGTVKISWEEPSSNGGLEIKSYKIYRGPERDNVSFLSEISSGEEFNDDTISRGEEYYYRISAVNDDGEGPMSMVFFVQVPEKESDEDESSGSIVLWIVLVAVIIAVTLLVIIVAALQSQKKKREEEEKDVPQLEESESEREERLIRERREMMAQYTDVSISTDDAHAADHEQHNLSYEDLYGDTSTISNGPAEEQPPASQMSDQQTSQTDQQMNDQQQDQTSTPQYQPPTGT
jgi:titin